MQDLLKFKILNELKSVYRSSHVKDRKESSAEHSWSSLMLADYFLTKFDYGLDRTKVYELLMYHDVVEIETGDIRLAPGIDRKGKAKNELEAAKKLKNKLPDKISEKFWQNFIEFEQAKTKEAMFAKAIDIFDATIQEIDYKEDWKGWSKEFLIENKSKYFEPFPELKKEFYKLLDWLEKEGYFSQ